MEHNFKSWHLQNIVPLKGSPNKTLGYLLLDISALKGENVYDLMELNSTDIQSHDVSFFCENLFDKRRNESFWAMFSHTQLGKAPFWFFFPYPQKKWIWQVIRKFTWPQSLPRILEPSWKKIKSLKMSLPNEQLHSS